MKIKVSPFSRKIWREYASVVAIASALCSFYFILVKVQENQRGKYAIIATALLITIYLIILVKANVRQDAKLYVNNSSVIIKIGNLFDEKGLKAIAFNEYFDTVVDDVLISKNSLNGEFILKLQAADVSMLDQKIAADSRLLDRKSGNNESRLQGKKVSYKLGSLFVDGEYLLVAFSRFDNDNRAFLSLKDYVSCLINFWDEVDQVYAGRSVTLPLLGSGITRFRDAEVTPQELLNILIWTFKISRVKFKHPAKVTIVIHDSVADKINFYDLGN